MLLIYTIKSGKSPDSDRGKIKSYEMKYTAGTVVSYTVEARCVNVMVFTSEYHSNRTIWGMKSLKMPKWLSEDVKNTQPNAKEQIYKTIHR